jgi:hypothetical protein
MTNKERRALEQSRAANLRKADQEEKAGYHRLASYYRGRADQCAELLGRSS